MRGQSLKGLKSLLRALVRSDSDSAPEPEAKGDTAPGPADNRASAREPWHGPGFLECSNDQGDLAVVPVRLLDRSDGGMRVLSEQPLDAGLTCNFKTGEQIARVVVVWCEPFEDNFHAGLRRVEFEQRRSDRYPISLPGDLDWTTPSGQRGSEPVIVTNWSQLGMQVRAQEEVPVPTLVRWRGEGMECQGFTTYCKGDKDGYRVGIHFNEPPYSIDGETYGS